MDSFLNASRHNSSIQWNQFNVLAESDYHLLQAHGSVLPVLLIEAISSEVSPLRSISVKIAKEGWAWLVCGRRLFVWKYLQSSRSQIESYELQLPGSDLLHKADLVCLVSYKSTHAPGVIAVSPEGTIRFWPNIAHSGHSIETVANDLQGQECFSLTDIEPLGYILGTTTSSLLHVYISNNVIHCRTLSMPQGVLAGFGRRVSSFIFGSLPASHSNENKPLLKVLKGSFQSDETVVFVLAATYLQKWIITDLYNEKLVCEYDLERTITDAYLSTVWNPDKVHPNQLRMWIIDMISQNEQLFILVAAHNKEVSNKIYYSIVVIDESSITVSGEINLSKFTVLRSHSPTYSPNSEPNLLALKMIADTTNPDIVYIYDNSKIFCCQWSNDVIDMISLNNRESQILGAGVHDGNLLLFTSKDNLIAVVPKDTIGQLLESYKTAPVVSKTQKVSESPLENLRTAFRLYRRKKMRECSVLASAFLSAYDSTSSDTGPDELVLKLSQSLCDESPSADPRWAESLRIAPNLEVISALLLKQLEDKLEVHRQFIDFLKALRIWSQLSLVNYNGCVALTKLILCEHTEKIIMAIAIKKLHQDWPEILDPVIERLVEIRGDIAEAHLTPFDLFYRKVTSIHEVFPLLIQYEEEELSACLNSPKDGLKLVISISDIIINVFHEIRKSKVAKTELYESLQAQNVEYIPLTATVGPSGIRTFLLKQLDVLVKNATRSDAIIALQDDEAALRTIIYQKIVDISDLILEGYTIQLKSIHKTSERYKLINKNFEADRSLCIKPLLQAKQYERACSLAEKYGDFETLIKVCEELDNKAKLNRYIEEFRDKGFSEFLFKWYMKEGKQGKMLTTRSQDLSNFLKDYDDINWVHYIGMDKFEDAANSLRLLAAKNDDNLRKKKTILSLGKLCILAGGADDEQGLQDINKQLEDIMVQETTQEMGQESIEDRIVD